MTVTCWVLTTIGVVRLLKAEKIPAGYKKMVRMQIAGDMKAALLLFTPDLWREDVLLANAGPCATLVLGNKGLELLRL